MKFLYRFQACSQAFGRTSGEVRLALQQSSGGGSTLIVLIGHRGVGKESAILHACSEESVTLAHNGWLCLNFGAIRSGGGAYEQVNRFGVLLGTKYKTCVF